jgi:hypothetical protein
MRLQRGLTRVGRWMAAAQPHVRGRWLFLRIVALCFLAVFWALNDQFLGLIGSQGVALLGARWVSLRSALGNHGLDVLMRCEAVLGIVLAALALVNVVPKVALLLATILWSCCLYELGPFDVYQPDAMLASAGLCAAVVAPPSFRPGLGSNHPPTRLELLTVWTLLFSIYWGSAVGKLQNPAWRSLTAMDHYWESAPVPAWTGWFVQTYLPRVAEQIMCAFVLASEVLGPILLFGGRRSRQCFVWLNLALQLGIASTAIYSFLNLLMIGLGMLALPDLASPPDPESENARPIVGRTQWRMVLRSVVPAVYVVASLVTTLPRLVPQSFRPFRVQQPEPGPGHVVNSYGLYEEVGRTGYRVEIQGSDDGTNWQPYRYHCLPMGEDDRPRIVWPYQCRLDWFMWRVSKAGFISDGGFVDAVVRGLASGSKQVASLFGDASPRQSPQRIRVALLQYRFATPAERDLGKWWVSRPLDVRELTPTIPQAYAR